LTSDVAGLFGWSGHVGQSATDGDDLVISGSTSYDQNLAALCQVHEEWSSSRGFNARMSRLQRGAGGLPSLVVGKTVFDDSSVDWLHRHQPTDWWIFTASQDRIVP